ncbi:MAG TPA: Fe-S cluster assembly protein NifU [Spirochaetota bacterium]|nr:Fe-S cluster assembly protein NifU [Spirochaetota bacterium]HOM10286.1 Fe-S cluster assembly protein NifU [Spirochaetota bacterium]HPP50129.1 Fe-S cluster assembly protein NifU [Spirochaetota bacterium]HXK66080.1 Fe-S cluster assembly protein NifU [Spirochaetota bacterium]
MWEYTEKVKELYKNPKNVGEIPDADVVVEVGSIVCGDALTLYLKLDGNKIIDAKFKTFGCGSAIASSSALTEMIKGKTIEEAAKITNKDIVEFLGGLPDQKMHCSVMGQEALEKAIKKIKGHAVEDEYEDEGAIVCQCFGISENLIRRVINENNLTTVEEVTNYTKAGGACGSCIPKIEDIIKEELAKGAAQKIASVQKPMSNLKRMQLVEETIQNVIRPVLMRDGGDIELIEIDGKKVYVALRGHCAHCVISDVTMKNLVQEKLREFVESDIEVIEVK